MKIDIFLCISLYLLVLCIYCVRTLSLFITMHSYHQNGIIYLVSIEPYFDTFPQTFLPINRKLCIKNQFYCNGRHYELMQSLKGNRWAHNTCLVKLWDYISKIQWVSWNFKDCGFRSCPIGFEGTEETDHNFFIPKGWLHNLEWEWYPWAIKLFHNVERLQNSL